MLYSDLNSYKDSAKRWIIPGLFIFLITIIVISFVIIQHQSRELDSRKEKIVLLEDEVRGLKKELELQTKLADAYKTAADNQLELFRQSHDNFNKVKKNLNQSLEKHKEYESQELPLDIRNIANGIPTIPLKPKE